MGKQGPCCHCGVTSTPLWRNGPPEKPVLCNACGSRWRTKGTLANYTPLHARADPDDYEDHRVSRVKSISINKNKDVKLLKRKANHDNGVVGGVVHDYNQGYRKVLDEDISNRSSSGSAISNSESCAQFGSADASDLTGPAQSVVWDSMVPSKKRTCVNRPKQSPVEKLTKDLYTILHEQQSSCFSGSSEEDLLFESETPMVSVEIGHGSVLIRHPSSIARDEESEASSLSVENKQCSTNEAYSHSLGLLVHIGNKNIHTPSLLIEKAKNPIGQGLQHEQLKRDKFQHERVQVLGNHNSPLCNVDLNDILNFEEFARYLTNEEQQQLLKYLPPVDTAQLPDSIKSMFDSPQFKENISCYQQLLAEGVFDISFSEAKAEDCNTLKRLTLSNLSKSKWVEHYTQLKKCRNSNEKSLVGRGPTVVSSSNSVSGKRSRDSIGQKYIEVKTMKSPKRISMKATYENKELMESDGTCFSPRSLFALPPDGGSFMLDSLHCVDESSDQDLLLDVPSNGSFAQAELLHPALSFGQQASTSSSSTYPHLLRP
ncbi:GATA transcription factor 26 [Ricinus communis]|uniref:GATA transcription factor, putative n=1 Tax=Ricinus communis TaxID=3988 RepID=B9SYZ6_RICCO|nr:GATA transcription factor 26 [Ricinus communis]EEF31151.1 GATA transcription factor, putative [Ricinus communis]|eukprot:XP_002531215.1 GATA transcription factor 26 [Ricinus communis]